MHARGRHPRLRPSIQVDPIRRRHAEEALVRVRLGGVAVCVRIPETTRAHADALAALLSDGDLDDDFVARKHEVLEAVFDVVGHLLGEN
eukprot:CAMPEP_0115217376 /NCGR_PEP_ID=MMETSP0270-20121206/25828_1 /TAXON_ID=71861 /ORGANISM="Scrippsiella trochoidea, Strain CCMP3099" /LENGTH=88 /DNA_ID=CAMNT_0002631255 /DNA_START=13 /DNA_END=279 /DNA_ORIENTATION=+